MFQVHMRGGSSEAHGFPIALNHGLRRDFIIPHMCRTRTSRVSTYYCCSRFFRSSMLFIPILVLFNTVPTVLKRPAGISSPSSFQVTINTSVVYFHMMKVIKSCRNSIVCVSDKSTTLDALHALLACKFTFVKVQ